MSSDTLVLFPGQGAYRPDLLPAIYRASDKTRAVLDEVNFESSGELSGTLDDSSPPLEQLCHTAPHTLQLAIFATSVALWTVHHESLPANAVITGHSFGEIAALTCAGVFTISAGARAVEARSKILQKLPQNVSGMLTINANAVETSSILAIVDDSTLAVACLNAPRQTVVAGNLDALREVADLARRIGFSTVQIASPYAFHSPIVRNLEKPYADALTQIPMNAPTRPIFMMQTGQRLFGADEVPTLLATQLHRPVNMMQTVQHFYAKGVNRMVECGAGNALVSTAAKIVPGLRTMSLADGNFSRPQFLGAVAVGRPSEDNIDLSENGHVHYDGSGTTSERQEHTGSQSKQTVPECPSVSSEQSVLDQLRAVYATELDYPTEVLDADFDLEADLGIDSIKQTAMLQRVVEEFDIERDDTIKISDYPTLGHIVKAIIAQSGGSTGDE
jgi:[acyl-carrier-protein] S-malonyltransferase